MKKGRRQSVLAPPYFFCRAMSLRLLSALMHAVVKAACLRLDISAKRKGYFVRTAQMFSFRSHRRAAPHVIS